MAALPIIVSYVDNRGLGSEERPWPDGLTMRPEQLDNEPKSRPEDSWSICQRCQDMCRLLKDSQLTRECLGADRMHLQTLSADALRKGIGSKCPFCQLVFETVPDIRDDEDIKLMLHLGKKAYTWTHTGRSDIEDGHAMHIHRAGKEPQKIRIATLEDEIFPELLYSIDSLEDTTTASTPGFALLKYWLRDCVTRHTNACPAWSMQSSRLPTRVIDVGAVDGSQTPRIFPNGGHHAPYITLSYRWEQERVITLKQDNLHTFTKALPYEQLSTVIQDAISITRRVGIQYLWVDALCIVQDSEADWAAESRQMQAVYQNAFFTIAVAPSGVRSDHGIFTPRKPGRLRPVELPIDASRRLFAFANKDNKQEDELELHKRAWTLQERLLSPRTATWKSGRLSFECGWHIVDESLPSKFAKSIDTPSPDYWAAMFHMRHTYSNSDPHSDMQVNMWEQCWRGIVQNYSARALTVGADRMMALFGVVQEMTRRKDDQYIVGLWRHRLEEQLLWRVTTDSPAQTSPKFEAPSWSWLSVPYPVTYKDMPLTSHLDDRFEFRTEIDIRFEGGEILPDESLSKIDGKLFSGGGLVRMYSRPNAPRRLYFTAELVETEPEDCIEWYPDYTHAEDADTITAIWLLRILSNDFGACFLCVRPTRSEERDGEAWTCFVRMGMCRIIIPHNKVPKEDKFTKDVEKVAEVAAAEALLDRTARQGFWDKRIILE